MGTAVKNVFAAVTCVERERPASVPATLPAEKVFEQLLLDAKLLPSTGSGGSSPIDAAVIQLKNQTVLPTTDLLNEAIRRYIEEHSNEKALELMETMATTCEFALQPITSCANMLVDGVMPNGVTRELMASLQLRVGNINGAVVTLMDLPAISPCKSPSCFESRQLKWSFLL